MKLELNVNRFANEDVIATSVNADFSVYNTNYLWVSKDAGFNDGDKILLRSATYTLKALSGFDQSTKLWVTNGTNMVSFNQNSPTPIAEEFDGKYEYDTTDGRYELKK